MHVAKETLELHARLVKDSKKAALKVWDDAIVEAICNQEHTHKSIDACVKGTGATKKQVALLHRLQDDARLQLAGIAAPYYSTKKKSRRYA
jgi:hypothetical protein